MNLSLLICTYNRHELLDQALCALFEESYEKPGQVVVVNGGDEQADAIVQRKMGRSDVEVKLVKTVNRNLAASRNIGLAQCTGEIVAMTDDDARVFPDWVTQMRRAHAEHPEAGAVGGLVLGADEASLVAKVADVITFPRWKQAQYVRTLPGVNISYKREVIDRVGPQDEALFRGEDVDYNWRVKQAGYQIFFDPRIKVHHSHRPTVRALLNQHYMYGRAYYLVRRKWPQMYCIYPHQIATFKDLLKLGNFFAGTVYQPVLSARGMPRLTERLRALPILCAAGLAWRLGMIRQGLKAEAS